MKRFIDLIYQKSPLQKKRLESFVNQRDSEYWSYANNFANSFSLLLHSKGIDESYAVDAYLKMCKDMITEQIKFQRSGNYSCTSERDSYNSVYSNERVMTDYMLGLALSQFLWPQHYEIFSFFNKVLTSYNNHSVKSYLEIGAGHGLFTSASMNVFGQIKFEIIDLSEHSINMCRLLLRNMLSTDFMPDMKIQNALDIDKNRYFDFITMGEVIEHVEKPKPLLLKINQLLSDNGVAFLTTCANCPAIDHIYLFKNCREIREMFKECGLEILREIAIPVEDVSVEKAEQYNLGINYAAVVKKAENI